MRFEKDEDKSSSFSFSVIVWLENTLFSCSQICGRMRNNEADAYVMKKVQRRKLTVLKWQIKNKSA